MLEATIEEHLGFKVQAGDMQLELFHGLSLNDVVLLAPEGFVRPPLRIKRLLVRYSLADILHRHLTVRSILIEEPTLRLVEVDGRNNLAALLAAMPTTTEKKEEKKEGGGGFAVELAQVQIRDAKIVIDTPAVQAELGGLTVAVNGLLTKPEQTQLQLRSSLARSQASQFRLPSVGALGEIAGEIGWTLDLDWEAMRYLRGHGELDLGLGPRHRLKVRFAINADSRRGVLGLENLEAELDGKAVGSATGLLAGRPGARKGKIEIASLVLPLDLWHELPAAWRPVERLSGDIRLESVIIDAMRPGQMPRASATVVIEDLDLASAAANLVGANGSFGLSLGGRGQRLAAAQGVLRADSFRAQGAQAQQVSLRFEAEALVPPDGTPWRLSLLSSKGTVAAKTAGAGQAQLRKMHIHWDGKLQEIAHDPVLGWMAAQAELELKAQADRVGLAGLSVARPRISLTGQADQVSLTRLPGRWKFQTSLGSGKIASADATLASLSASLSGSARSRTSSAWPFKLRLKGKDLSLALGSTLAKRLTLPDAFGLNIKGKVARLTKSVKIEQLEGFISDWLRWQGAGQLDRRAGRWQARIHLLPFSLSAVAARLPPGLAAAWPAVAGFVEIESDAAGPFPPPKQGWAAGLSGTLRMRDVAWQDSDRGLALEQLSGQLRWTVPEADWRNLTGELSLMVGALRLTESGLQVGGLRLSLDAKAAGEDWLLKGKAQIGQLDGGRLLPGFSSRVQMSLDSKLLGKKELRLRELQLKLPDLGCQLRFSGRLTRPTDRASFAGLHFENHLDISIRNEQKVIFPGGVSLRGDADLSLSVQSTGPGVVHTEGKLLFAGLDVWGKGFHLQDIQGTIPASQDLKWQPEFKLQADKQAKADQPSGRSSAYDQILRPLQGAQRSFSVRRIEYQDMVLERLSAKLELARGRLSLGNLRFGFLGGDVLATAVADFAPPPTRRLSLDAEMSGVDIGGLGTLPVKGSAEVSGNLRVGVDWAAQTVSTSMNLTQIGRSTLQALLMAIDPAEANPGVMKLRRFLADNDVSPRRVSVKMRHGQLGMEVKLKMGSLARTIASFIQGFQGDTFLLPPMPVGGILYRYLGF